MIFDVPYPVLNFFWTLQNDRFKSIFLLTLFEDLQTSAEFLYDQPLHLPCVDRTLSGFQLLLVSVSKLFLAQQLLEAQ